MDRAPRGRLQAAGPHAGRLAGGQHIGEFLGGVFGGSSGRAGRAACGFTLLEVLVALAIVGVALAAGLRAAGSLTGNAARLAEVSAAQWCADNALAGLRLAGQLPGIGDADFGCEQLGRSYRGQLRTRATPNPNFRRVDAVVVDDAGQVLVSVSTVQGGL